MPAKIPPRRQCLPVLPELMAIYHIKPWDLDEMTNDEIVEMLKDLARRKEAEVESADDSDGNSGRARRKAASRRRRR